MRDEPQEHRPMTEHMRLVPVTADNWEDCARLKVGPTQRAYVAEVTWYLCDCAYGEVWKPVAAVLDGEVVGFAVWGLDDDGSGWIGGVVVDESRQGRGIGRRLVTLLMERLVRDEGCPSLGLTYAPDNARARGLYLSLGFEETGELDGEEVVARWRPLQG